MPYGGMQRRAVSSSVTTLINRADADVKGAIPKVPAIRGTFPVARRAKNRN